MKTPKPAPFQPAPRSNAELIADAVNLWLGRICLWQTYDVTTFNRNQIQFYEITGRDTDGTVVTHIFSLRSPEPVPIMLNAIRAQIKYFGEKNIHL